MRAVWAENRDWHPSVHIEYRNLSGTYRTAVLHALHGAMEQHGISAWLSRSQDYGIYIETSLVGRKEDTARYGAAGPEKYITVTRYGRLLTINAVLFAEDRVHRFAVSGRPGELQAMAHGLARKMRVHTHGLAIGPAAAAREQQFDELHYMQYGRGKRLSVGSRFVYNQPLGPYYDFSNPLMGVGIDVTAHNLIFYGSLIRFSIDSAVMAGDRYYIDYYGTFQAAAGAGVMLPVLRRVSLGAYGFGGLYVHQLHEKNHEPLFISDPFAGIGAEVQVYIVPRFVVTVSAAVGVLFENRLFVFGKGEIGLCYKIAW